MKLCQWTVCELWAQWILTTAEGKIRNLCNQHKEELERQLKIADIETGVKFRFIGAMPDGSDDTQSAKNSKGTSGNW